MKRAAIVMAVVVVLLATLLVWASKGDVEPRAKVWELEPTVYLGVQLGKPLEASIPKCLGPDDKRLCFDGTYIANEPDPVSSTMPFVEGGIVTQLNTTYRASAEDLIRQDLKQKYGEPQSSYFGNESWDGKVIRITLTSPPEKSEVGWLTATLVHPPKSDQPPHKNPF